VSLHTGCERPWREAQEHPKADRAKAGGLVSSLAEDEHDRLARWYAGIVFDDDGHQTRADSRLRHVLGEMVPTEAIEREYKRVMRSIDRLAGDGDQANDGIPLQ